MVAVRSLNPGKLVNKDKTEMKAQTRPVYFAQTPKVVNVGNSRLGIKTSLGLVHSAHILFMLTRPK